MGPEIFRIFLQHVVVNVYKISNHSEVVMFLARWNGMECLKYKFPLFDHFIPQCLRYILDTGYQLEYSLCAKSECIFEYTLSGLKYFTPQFSRVLIVSFVDNVLSWVPRLEYANIINMTCQHWLGWKFLNFWYSVRC